MRAAAGWTPAGIGSLGFPVAAGTLGTDPLGSVIILYLDGVEMHRRKTPDTPYMHVNYIKVWKYVNVPAH